MPRNFQVSSPLMARIEPARSRARAVTIQIEIFAYRTCAIAIFAMPFVDDQVAILRKV
jgi:hypothetical protein